MSAGNYDNLLFLEFVTYFINSSVAGIQAYKGGSIYCASKHAVQAISNSLRKELVDKNVKVTSICPGNNLIQCFVSLFFNENEYFRSC